MLVSMGLFFHPFYLNNKLNEDSFQEKYMESSPHNTFQRNSNDLFAISQITCHFVNIIILLFRFSVWGCSSFRKFCKANKIKYNTFLLMKLFLNEYPELFSIGLFVAI